MKTPLERQLDEVAQQAKTLLWLGLTNTLLVVAMIGFVATGTHEAITMGVVTAWVLATLFYAGHLLTLALAIDQAIKLAGSPIEEGSAQ